MRKSGPKRTPVGFAATQFRAGIEVRQNSPPPADVSALPPACDRWEIMRGGHGQRLAPPARAWDERAPVALEPQHLHPCQASIGQHIAKTIGKGAQIFSDH